MQRKAETTYEEKFRIMREYIELTGQSIGYSTVYKGMNLGAWQNNIRHYYKKGILKISEELEEAFKSIGVLEDLEEGEPKRKGKKIPYEEQKQMYSAIKEFVVRHPYSLDIYSCSIGEYVKTLQQQYNIGRLILSPEEIENLIALEILRPIGIGKSVSERFGISKQAVRYINVKYGNIDKFIIDYKNGELNLSEEEMRLCGIQNPVGIVLSEYDISAKQKMGYIRLLNDVCTPVQIETFYNSGYINIDDVNQLLQTLPEKQQRMLEVLYGLNGQNARTLYQISNKTGVSHQRINLFVERILDSIREDFGKIVKSKDALYEMEQLLKNGQPDIQTEQIQQGGMEEYYKLQRENTACAKAYYNFVRRESIFNPNQVIEATISRSENNQEMIAQKLEIEKTEESKENEEEKLKRQAEIRERLEKKYAGIKRKRQAADKLLKSLTADLLAAGIITDGSSYRGEE